MRNARHGFSAWLGATTLSTVGDSVTFFALGWVASGAGAGAAGVVLTAGSIPLCLLILVGGSLADRYGVRWVMVRCDAAMAVVMAVLAVATLVGTPVWLLAAAEFLGGTAAALRRPAQGVFPRLFSDGEDLARRMATVGAATQLARVAGPSLGGLLVGAGGLPLTSALDAGSFLLVFAVLLLVRPPYESDHVTSAGRGWRSVVAGAGAARRTPGIPGMLLVITGLAATVLPYVMLCVPLLGRDRGWAGAQVGLVSASWIAGGLLVTAVVARRGAPGHRVASAGALVAAAGVLGVLLTSSLVSAIAATVLVGLGTSLLTARLLPAFVAATPPDMLARYQSLGGLAQTGPVLVVMPALGAVAASAGVEAALGVVAAGLVLTTVAAASVLGRAVEVDAPPGAATQDEPGRSTVAADR